ncbi:homoserine dehydrogenase [Siccirubricoccus deserti]|uniref:Homoserine dehydrogenase n=1 Tax=Siccirubricoccus deserti TaxID=2013562 RepID=A0A9X0UI25_9PROT|nr:homoserine dehydrogenase [Siccirubricoccus deserti]MBC4016690.1 homoserine dehydrogenase [Siccirubricoccus deserti]GGC51149.1 homoserine dehydrogenase [Siccirubricoccus deserti]
MSKPLSVAVAGLGTVGAGVLKLLAGNADIVAARAGRPVVVGAVSARDRRRNRGVKLDGLRWYDDPVALATDPGTDVVVELIGGSDGPARALVEAALAAGKPVVTANKALLAVHGAAIAELAEARGVPLAFEAAVAGGIPAIKGLREGLAANRIQRVAGILNGTCNYILTVMREAQREFAEVLAEAQKLGYAEADPSFDIDGIDAAHKLAILAALAFGRPVDFAAVHVEGIRAITALDILLAGELGYRIKLLGIAARTEGGISTRVHPCMVPVAAPIARVDGVFNAVVAEGDHVGRVMLEGRGAGAGPTASAVVADLIDIAQDRVTPVWGAAGGALSTAPSEPMERHVGAYYLRLMVVDRPGVIADVTGILRDQAISLESMLQRGRAPGEAVPVVLTTHDCEEAAMRAAITRIAALDVVLEPPAMIRIEPL